MEQDAKNNQHSFFASLSRLSHPLHVLPTACMILLVVGTATTVFLTQNQQDIRNRAAEGIMTPGLQAPTTESLVQTIQSIGSPSSLLSDPNTLNSKLINRKGAMLQLMKQDPQKAFQLAFIKSDREKFPQTVQNLIEQIGTVQGIIQPAYFDDFTTKTSHHEYFLTTNTNSLSLASTSDLSTYTNSTVTLTGLLLGSVVAIDNTPAAITVMQQTAMQQALTATSTTTQQKKVAIVLINFQDVRDTPYDIARIRSSVFTNPTSARAFFWELSFHKMWLTGIQNPDGDFYGYYTLPITAAPATNQPYTNCDRMNDWLNTTVDYAKSQGANLSAYDYVIVIAPHNNYCEIATGGWRGNVAFFSGYTPDTLNPPVISHELGHSMGIGHSNTYTCKQAGSTVPLSNNCTSSEYGDTFSVMSLGPYYHMNNYEMYQLGIWQPNQIQTVTQSGVYKITPPEFDGSAVKIIKIPHNASTSLFLEYRKPGGIFDTFKATDPVVNGISIRVASNNLAQMWSTQLIDPTPDGNFYDSSLKVNQSVFDPVNGATIKTLTALPSSATLSITFSPPTCIQKAPTLQVTPLAPSAKVGQIFTYSVKVTNNDSTGCDALPMRTQFEIYSPLVISGSSSHEEILTPGASYTYTQSVSTLPTAVIGSYRFGVTADQYPFDQHSFVRIPAYLPLVP